MHRSCADVNFPFKRKCTLVNLIYYSEVETSEQETTLTFFPSKLAMEMCIVQLLKNYRSTTFLKQFYFTGSEF
jgi:hypothetical protein